MSRQLFSISRGSLCTWQCYSNKKLVKSGIETLSMTCDIHATKKNKLKYDLQCI
jgi:hypothetical protein